VDKNVTIIGAGLAGSEAALQLAKHGFNVTVFEAKPHLLEAYRLSSVAELICNNSFGERDISQPKGMLISELIEEKSELISIAQCCAVNDPKYLAVDVISFSNHVKIAFENAKINCISGEIQNVPASPHPLIIATGPLTSIKLADSISKSFNIQYSEYTDACCPIIDINSVDLTDKGIRQQSNDLFELELDDDTFVKFADALANGKVSDKYHGDFSFDFKKVYTVETLVKHDMDLNLLKSRFHIGGNRIIIYLRRESALKDGFILAGCTTMLSNSSQKRAFSILPGLVNCKFIRFGRMHRNTFFQSPGHLDYFYNIIGTKAFLAGQLSGIDGYTEAISSGLIAAKRIIYGQSLKPYSTTSMMGALANYVSNINITSFQPMGASFSILKK